MRTFSSNINYGIFEPTIIAKLTQMVGADFIRQVFLDNRFTQKLVKNCGFNRNKACEAVAKIFYAGIVTSVLEFMHRDATDSVMRYVNHSSTSVKNEIQVNTVLDMSKNYMDIAFPKVQLDLMRSIKKVFDPNSILNLGKVLPDS